MPSIVGGRYRLDTLIGGGGMGEVWSAHDDVLERTVAVKIIRAHLAGDADVRSRLRVEAQLAGSLRHHGIVDVFDYGEDEVDGATVPYLVMPFIDGATLSQVLAARGSLTTGETMAIVAEMADALQTAHDAGIVHRDLKPANVLLTRSGRVMLVDFGIARSIDGESLTKTGTLIGTADYLSPEQAAGRTATPASDLYSLGVVTFACLTGTPPFRRDSDIATALAHIQAPMPDLPPLVVADGVGPLVEKLLAKDPSDRPTSAGDVATAARGFATEVPIPAAASVAGVVAGVAGLVTKPGNTLAPTAPHPAPLAVPLAAVALGSTSPHLEQTGGTSILPAQNGTRPRRRPRRVAILGASALAIAAVVFGLMFFGGSQIEVPDVRGKTSAQASAVIADADLTLRTRKVDAAGFKAGEVVSQSPGPGDMVDKESVVTVTVATGAIAIPDLIGATYEDAAKQLKDLGLVPARVDAPSTKEPGTVLSVDPSKRAKLGETVALTVASEPSGDTGKDDSSKGDDKGKGKKDDVTVVPTEPVPTELVPTEPEPTATEPPVDPAFDPSPAPG